MSIERKSDGSIVLPRSMGLSVGIGAPETQTQTQSNERRGIRGTTRNLGGATLQGLKTAKDLPESRLFIPSTRPMTASELYEERCKSRPAEQEWGAGWIDYAPQLRAVDRHSFTVVFLDVFATESDAHRYRERVTLEYPKRPLIVFRIGYWLALPVPRWLRTEAEVIAYNRTVTVGLISKDVQATRVKHAIIKRRAKQQGSDYSSPEVETSKLESGGDDWIPPTEEARRVELDDYKSQWVAPSASCRSKYKYGLAWVLPNVQNPGHMFEHVTFAWLGAYMTDAQVQCAQATIREGHPEWNVAVFELGNPVSLPVPMWLLQLDRKVVYDQPYISELMSQAGPPCVSPEVVEEALLESAEDEDVETAVINELVGDDEASTDTEEELASDEEIETLEVAGGGPDSRLTMTVDITKKKCGRTVDDG
jgi:hypothetical protein